MGNAPARHYFVVWLWLIGLIIIAAGAAALLPKLQAMVLIFGSAVVKALLVARHYMHLKNEKAVTYAIVLVPLGFVIILLFALFPDFVYR